MDSSTKNMLMDKLNKFLSNKLWMDCILNRL